MDDLSINGALPSTTPVKEIQSRHSGSGEQQQSRNRHPAPSPELSEEESDLPEDESPHAVDEQA
jgi:hypothetical protein